MTNLCFPAFAPVTACIGFVLAFSSPAQAMADNLLYIGEGGVVLPDQGEEDRHWSEWSINLIEGTTGFGWTSDPGITLPHALKFEIGGIGLIEGFTLDAGFIPVKRYDAMSEPSEGAPLRSFTVYGAVESAAGPYTEIFDGELAKGERETFKLDKPVRARWLKLVVESNWGDESQSYLAEFEALGTLEERAQVSKDDIDGVYDHEYGAIVLRKDGSRVTGCYGDGRGRLEGQIYGRILRMTFLEPDMPSIGAATFAWANDTIFGFWYQRDDQMGSPWTANKISGLEDVDLGGCKGVLKGAD